MADVPVKLDKELKKKIEELISQGENRFEFPSVKNFVDKAVLKLLKDLEKKRKKSDEEDEEEISGNSKEANQETEEGSDEA